MSDFIPASPSEVGYGSVIFGFSITYVMVAFVGVGHEAAKPNRGARHSS